MSDILWRDHEATLSSRDAERWWNIKQAAAYLGVSIAFLRKAVRLGKIPYVRVGSKVLRFRRTELDLWLEASGTWAKAGTK